MSKSKPTLQDLTEGNHGRRSVLRHLALATLAGIALTPAVSTISDSYAGDRKKGGGGMSLNSQSRSRSRSRRGAACTDQGVKVRRAWSSRRRIRCGCQSKYSPS